MKKKSKFEIGDKVWVIVFCSYWVAAHKVRIGKIRRRGNRISYFFPELVIELHGEDDVFRTKREAEAVCQKRNKEE